MSGKYLRKKIRQPFLPVWIFIPAMVLYNELLLHFWTVDAVVPARALTVTLFALAFGGALGFLASLLGPRAQKWTSVVITVLISVVTLMEYFLHDAYQNFMPFVTIFAGAGGVMTDYLSMVLSLLVRNLWRIGLVLLPILVFAIFGRCVRQRWSHRLTVLLASLLLYGASFGAVFGFGLDASQLGGNYEFDSAVNAFGLNTAMIQDLVYSSGAVGQGLEFETLEPAPTAGTQPSTAESESTAATETTGTTGAAEEGDPAESTGATEEPTTEATEPAPIIYADNVLPLDFEELAATTSNSYTKPIHTYVASVAPSQKNAYSGMFAGKNLIFITAEAFSTPVIDPELTPTLYRLANEGIKFTDYYQPAWGASTTSGEYSNLIGLVPTNGGSCMNEAYQQDLFLTIGSQLQALGYHSTAYHNHSHTYYSRNKTHKGLGYNDFIAIGSGMQDVKGVWPESDLEMMQFSIDQYIDQQPFNIYYMSVSGHSVYTQQGNAMARKNYSVVENMECSEALKCYFAAQLEFEYAMEYLVQQLEDAGIADDTVIVISTDHYPYGLDKSSTYGNSKNYLYELYGVDKMDFLTRDSSSLIIWSGCLEDKDIVIDTPVYSLDILPTLSNLFGVNYDSRLLIGRDVFSTTDPLVLWGNGSWKTTLGTYDASKRTFTPVEGAEIPEDYVAYTSAIVNNKIKYSKSVANTNYFNEVVKYLTDVTVG